jgi:hypothetical protein
MPCVFKTRPLESVHVALQGCAAAPSLQHTSLDIWCACLISNARGDSGLPVSGEQGTWDLGVSSSVLWIIRAGTA